MDEILRQLAPLLIGSVPTIVIFLVLVLGYKYILYGPLLKVLAERRSRTAGAIERAEAAIAAADAKAREYEDKLRAARAESPCSCSFFRVQGRVLAAEHAQLPARAKQARQDRGRREIQLRGDLGRRTAHQHLQDQRLAILLGQFEDREPQFGQILGIARGEARRLARDEIVQIHGR